MSLPVLRDLAAAGGPRLSIAVIDAGGRLQDLGAVAALGWRPGDRLLITLVKTSAVFRRRFDGAFVMRRKPYVALPAAVRRACRTVVGSRLLLSLARLRTCWSFIPKPPCNPLRAFHASLADAEEAAS